MPFFPSLDGFGPTRATLHLYAHAMGTLPRVHLLPHPKWWHISLKVRPDGLVTDNIPLPGGGIFHLRMDLHDHAIVAAASDGRREQFDMRAGMTGTEMGEAIIDVASRWGLDGDYVPRRFENDEPRTYDEQVAGRYFTAIANASRVFTTHQATISGNTSPVQVWPHGFDISCEWFGTRTVRATEHGESKEYPSQLNLGFYPGEDNDQSYFYSNPFPFEAGKLLNKSLPEGARWFNESWQGTLLPYTHLINDPDPERRLLTYAMAVFRVASPTLVAPESEA